VGKSLRAGVDVVTFSGDKLLGGPQAGILTGKRERLEPIRKNPLFRALRVDKLTIAALEATVACYLRDDLDAIPALRMMRLKPEEISPRATRLAERVAEIRGFSALVEAGESVIGGGSTPGHSLLTPLVRIRQAQRSAQELESRLRRNSPPIIARVESDQVVLDLRTVFEEQDEEILQAFKRLASQEHSARPL
jgi:L-seryl-tRNA(Ser) seleniumtransferase